MRSFVILNWFISALHLIDMFILSTMFLLVVDFRFCLVDQSAFGVIINVHVVVFHGNECTVCLALFSIVILAISCLMFSLNVSAFSGNSIRDVVFCFSVAFS